MDWYRNILALLTRLLYCHVFLSKPIGLVGLQVYLAHVRNEAFWAGIFEILIGPMRYLKGAGP